MPSKATEDKTKIPPPTPITMLFRDAASPNEKMPNPTTAEAITMTVTPNTFWRRASAWWATDGFTAFDCSRSSANARSEIIALEA